MTSQKLRPLVLFGRTPLRVQFTFQTLAILDVQGLHHDELRQQAARRHGIVAVALQLGDELGLPGNMFFALGHVMAGAREMPELELPVHCSTIAET
jgi:hypothetical protein